MDESQKYPMEQKFNVVQTIPFIYKIKYCSGYKTFYLRPCVEQPGLICKRIPSSQNYLCPLTPPPPTLQNMEEESLARLRLLMFFKLYLYKGYKNTPNVIYL